MLMLRNRKSFLLLSDTKLDLTVIDSKFVFCQKKKRNNKTLPDIYKILANCV